MAPYDDSEESIWIRARQSVWGIRWIEGNTSWSSRGRASTAALGASLLTEPQARIPQTMQQHFVFSASILPVSPRSRHPTPSTDIGPYSNEIRSNHG